MALLAKVVKGLKGSKYLTTDEGKRLVKDAKTPEEYKEAFEKRLGEIHIELMKTSGPKVAELNKEKSDILKTLSEIKAGTWWGGKLEKG